MTKFLDCGELALTNGKGFEPPLILAVKNGVLRGDLYVLQNMIKDGKLNFSVEIKEVKGYFDCSDRKLTTLESCPEKVDGDFSCSYNRLTSLEGCPQKVFGDFNCQWNKITTLKGAPDKVGGDFNCQWNKITTLKGAPDKVGGDFDIRENARQFTEEEVRAVCDVKGRVYV